MSTQTKSSQRLTLAQFIQRANKVHNSRYDYSAAVYINRATKLKIVCTIHGEFLQNPGDHLSGSNCPACAAITRHANRTKTQEEFVNQCKQIHSDKYLYDLTTYKNVKQKIQIICPTHGIFEQTPNDHLTGHGCMKCASITRAVDKKHTLEEFIKNARNVHGDKYDYSLTEYTNTMSKVSILCKKHNSVFEQVPNNHVSGKAGCPKCSVNISKKENAWLNYCGLPDTKEHRQTSIHINHKLFKVDGFDLETNTIYEFWGDYWHGNPAIYSPTEINKNSKKTFEFLYNRTIAKKKAIIDAGFNLIEMWEADWDSIMEKQNVAN